MRAASTYRGARRNAIRPLFYWIDGERHKSKERSPWIANSPVQSKKEKRSGMIPQIKERYVIYTGKMYQNGWRSVNERKAAHA